MRYLAPSPRRGSVARGCLILVALTVLLLGVLVAFSVGKYNGVVSAEESVDASWSQVENMYERRSELIPQLVEVVKGAADFEKSTLNDVIEARKQVTNIQIPENITSDPAAMQKFMAAQNGLGSALTRLLAVAEAYPDLKASQNFLSLQDEIAGSDNRIATSRTDYIEQVKLFNTNIKKFPMNLFASTFNFEEKAQFTSDESKREAPKIDFGTTPATTEGE